MGAHHHFPPPTPSSIPARVMPRKLQMPDLLDIARIHPVFAAAAINELRESAETFAADRTRCDWRAYRAIADAAQAYLDVQGEPEDEAQALDEIDALLDPPDTREAWEREGYREERWSGANQARVFGSIRS
jgi:hypothetical protein